MALVQAVVWVVAGLLLLIHAGDAMMIVAIAFLVVGGLGIVGGVRKT